MSAFIDIAASLAAFGAWAGMGALVGRRFAVPRPVVRFASLGVFNVGLPALILASLVRADMGLLADQAFIGCFLSSTAVSGGIAWWYARRLLGQGVGASTLYCMSCAYVNSVNLGLPLAQRVLGSVGPAVTLGLVQMVVITPAILSIVEYERQGGAGVRAILRKLPGRLLGNPIILACLAGLAAHAFPAALPGAVLDGLRSIGRAAIPLSLVLLGHDLAAGNQESDGGEGAAPVIVALVLKLGIQPLTALGLGVFVFHLPAAALLAVVLIAGLPAPQNNYVFAKRYGIGVTRTARIVTASTALFGASALVILGVLPR